MDYYWRNLSLNDQKEILARISDSMLIRNISYFQSNNFDLKYSLSVLLPEPRFTRIVNQLSDEKLIDLKDVENSKIISILKSRVVKMRVVDLVDMCDKNIISKNEFKYYLCCRNIDYILSADRYITTDSSYYYMLIDKVTTRADYVKVAQYFSEHKILQGYLELLRKEKG
ncbi:MAG: hypothetical protein WDK96_04060 [Candidatus Paceibacterota bacterium]